MKIRIDKGVDIPDIKPKYAQFIAFEAGQSFVLSMKAGEDGRKVGNRIMAGIRCYCTRNGINSKFSARNEDCRLTITRIK